MSALDKIRIVLNDSDERLADHVREALMEAVSELEALRPSAHEFFVIMLKRGDGKTYPDINKTDERMYLSEEDADAALMEKGDVAHHFHKVRMAAVLADEWE